MNQEAALEYVRLQSDSQSEPSISDSEILGVLELCRIADREGNPPGSTDWTESYWIPRAIADVLALRVLRASGWVDVTTDGTSFAASQALNALKLQESRWRRRCVAGA
jgi:hypothetical protein